MEILKIENLTKVYGKGETTKIRDNPIGFIANLIFSISSSQSHYFHLSPASGFHCVVAPLFA